MLLVSNVAFQNFDRGFHDFRRVMYVVVSDSSKGPGSGQRVHVKNWNSRFAHLACGVTVEQLNSLRKQQ